MAVYPFSSTPNSYIELKAAIEADPNLEMLNDNGSSSLTFRHIGLGLVFNFSSMTNSNPTISIGKSWVSGASPVNAVRLSSITYELQVQGGVVVHEDFFLFHFYRTSSSYFALVAGRLENGESVCLVIGRTNMSNSTGYRALNETALKVAGFRVITNVVDTAGKYLQIPLYVTDGADVAVCDAMGVPIPMVGAHILFKPPNLVASTIEVIGTDILVSTEFNYMDNKAATYLFPGRYV